MHLPEFPTQPTQPRKPLRIGRTLFQMLTGVRGILLWVISACLLGVGAIAAWRFLYFVWKASGRAKDYIDHNL